VIVAEQHIAHPLKSMQSHRHVPNDCHIAPLSR